MCFEFVLEVISGFFKCVGDDWYPKDLHLWKIHYFCIEKEMVGLTRIRYTVTAKCNYKIGKQKLKKILQADMFVIS